MNTFLTMTLAGFMASAQPSAQQDQAGLFNSDLANDVQPLMIAAGPDDRKDRREERGRSDERQDKRDCRQKEGAVGKDKRDCKQEEVRDGVRGNQGGKDDESKDKKDDNA